MTLEKDAAAIGAIVGEAAVRVWSGSGARMEYGTVTGIRDDGSLTVSVGGGTVVARALASVDVGASVGCQVMLSTQGHLTTVIGTVGGPANFRSFSAVRDQARRASDKITEVEERMVGYADDMDAVKESVDRYKETAEQRITQVSQKVDEQEGSILSKVAAEYVKDDELESKLAESSTIEQLPDAIIQQVNQSFEADGGVLSRVSKLETSVDGITSTVEDALTKTEAGETYATKALVEQTSQGLTTIIQQTVFEAPYVLCQTAADVQAKQVAAPEGFQLKSGACLTVRFSSANSVAYPTLSVGGGAAHEIVCSNYRLSANSVYGWVANSVVPLVFDGTYWRYADANANFRNGQSLTAARNAQNTADGAVESITDLQTIIREDADGITVGKSATVGGETFSTARTRVGSDGTFSILPAGSDAAMMELDAGALHLDIGNATTSQVAGDYSRQDLYIGKSTNGDVPDAGVINTADDGNLRLAAPAMVQVYNKWDKSGAANAKGAYRAGLTLAPNGSTSSQGDLLATDADGATAADVAVNSGSVAMIRANSLVLSPKDFSQRKTYDMASLMAFLGELSLQERYLSNGTAILSKRGSVVTVQIAGYPSDGSLPGFSGSGNWPTYTVAQLPVGWAPKRTVRAPLLYLSGGGQAGCYFEVHGTEVADGTAGRVDVVNPQTGAVSNLHGCVTFVV